MKSYHSSIEWNRMVLEWDRVILEWNEMKENGIEFKTEWNGMKVNGMESKTMECKKGNGRE